MDTVEYTTKKQSPETVFLWCILQKPANNFVVSICVYWLTKIKKVPLARRHDVIGTYHSVVHSCTQMNTHGGKVMSGQALRAPCDELSFCKTHTTEVQCKKWQMIFSAFGVVCDTTQLRIPVMQPGFERLIVVPRGITLKQILAIMKTMFDVRTPISNLDALIATDARSNVHAPYAVFTTDQQDAPVTYAGYSANKIDQNGILAMTLKERLLYEVIYFIEQGLHLDVATITLCTGSRCTHGFVPYVDLNPRCGSVEIASCIPSASHHPLRARTVIV